MPKDAIVFENSFTNVKIYDAIVFDNSFTNVNIYVPKTMSCNALQDK